MHSLLTTGNIVNKDFAYYELPLKLDIFDDKTFQNSKTKFLINYRILFLFCKFFLISHTNYNIQCLTFH